MKILSRSAKIIKIQKDSRLPRKTNLSDSQASGIAKQLAQMLKPWRLPGKVKGAGPGGETERW